LSTGEQIQQGIPTGVWNADTVHSRIGFEVSYAVATFSGELTNFEATLDNGQLTGRARIESLPAKEPNLQAHLLSPEFFDAERHPEVTFSSTEMSRHGDDVEIEGEITIKGRTQPTKLTGKAMRLGTRTTSWTKADA
jgi:polyisoprenoid-binding protein YceI